MKWSIVIFFFVFTLFSCQEKPSSVKNDVKEWTYLLDQKLSNFDNYISFKHQVGYQGKPPVDENGELISPVGLNKSGYDVFTVIQENDEPILRISGEYYGCVMTKNEYENYHLKLKVKWGDKKWDPRKKLLKDSGILYHSIGPMGAEHWRSWMLSQEFQVMQGHMGDYWAQANSAIDIRAYIPEYIMNPVADPSQEFIGIGTGELIQGFCLRSNNYEKEHGEWNTIELICFENKSIHIVNGEVVMILKNSRYVEEDGKKIPMPKGRIQIQSEAAEVFYKDIAIRPLRNLPEDYRRFYPTGE